MPRGGNGQRDRGHHKDDGRPGGGPGKGISRAAWAEGSLAAHTAESRGNIAAFAALQQHYDDEEEADRYVNDGDKNNHVIFT